MARLTKNCLHGHRDLLSSFPKRPYFLSSGEWTLRNNFSRASWFIRVLSAHSRTRVWGRDLPVTPVILRNKGFPCITSMIIPSPSSHCILGRCRLPGHEIEPARVSPGLLLIHPVKGPPARIRHLDPLMEPPRILRSKGSVRVTSWVSTQVNQPAFRLHLPPLSRK